MSASLDGVNVISTDPGPGSGESDKGGIDDVVVGDLGRKTLIENSDGKLNEADGVRALDEAKVLNGELLDEARNDGSRLEEVDGSNNRVVKQLSDGDDGWGMMGLVGRVLGGTYAVDKNVGASSSCGNRPEVGINGGVAVGEATCVNGTGISGNSLDEIGINGNSIKEDSDTVSSVLHGKLDSATNEQVLDGKSDAKVVENVEADVLMTQGCEKQDSISNDLVKDGKSETKGVDNDVADALMTEDGKQNPLTNELVPDGKVEIEEVDNAFADVLMTEGDGKEDHITTELVLNGEREVEEAAMSMTEGHGTQHSIAGESVPDGKLKIEGVVNAQDEVLKTKGSDLVTNEVVPDGKSEFTEVLNVEADMFMTGGNGEQSANEMNAEYSASDIVWGKVRSHPWWPGQIFAPSDASDKAAKYLKKDCHLIAYFGDQTFAWNEISKIKPFHMNFSEMEKQNNTEGFLHAVSCALDEVSRRVEVGLSCRCLPEEVSNKIKTQEFLNAGIKEESSRREVRDRLFTAASFVPEELLEFVQLMAEVPGFNTDRFQLAMMKSQLLAFNRWKGCYQLPLLEEFGELMEEDNQFVAEGERSDPDGVLPICAGTDEVALREKKSTAPDVSSQKRNRPSFDEKLPDTREKQISVLMSSSSPKSGGDKTVKKGGRKRKLEPDSSIPNNPEIDGDKTVKKRGRKRKLEHASSIPNNPEADVVKTVKKRGRKRKLEPASSIPNNPETDDVKTLKKRGRKRKQEPASSISNNPEVQRQENPKSSGVADQMPLQPRKNPGVGKRLIRAVKSNEKLQGSVNEKLQGSVTPKSQGGEIILANSPTPGEIFSKLSLAARNPMQAHDILVPVDALLREFRNSVCLEKPLPQGQMPHVGNEGKRPCNSQTTDMFAFDGREDPSWKNRSMQNSSQSKMLSESEVPVGESVESGINIDGNVNLDDEKEKDTVVAAEDSRPTALILNFSNVESIPPVSTLNEIFRPFGALKESETEILIKSKRAKVIFEKKADADAAFSSTGKYSTFGPSLISYRLNYAPSPRKASATSKRNKKKNP